jgi:hypothetical protein
MENHKDKNNGCRFKEKTTSEKPCSTRRLCGGDCRAYAKLSDDLIWSRMITDYIQEAPGIYVMMK